MKYKIQSKQNQLIERITDKHLVVGIDIAQQVHVARAINYRGIIVGDPLEFENDANGFARLQAWMNILKKEKGYTTEIVGMEPTGHYSLAVIEWLTDKKIDVVTVNPYLVKRNKENRDNTQSKSDRKDALVIADMVKNGYYSIIRPTKECFEILRVLMSNRDVIVKRYVSAANQINRWIDIIFPEFRQVFKDVKGKGALATLHLFPSPKELGSMEPKDVVKAWKTVMKRQPGVKKAQVLIQLAKESIGNKKAHDAYKMHLELLLEEFDLATTQLEIIGVEVKNALNEITFSDKLLAIDGLSETTVGALLGEAGDLSQFAHGDSLMRHAGLNLVEASSGKWKGQIVISKRGRSRLRRFLYLATISLVVNNAEFKKLHEHNVTVKKMKKMKSIMKLIGKFARIIVGIAQRNEAYCPVKVQPVTKLAA